MEQETTATPTAGEVDLDIPGVDLGAVDETEAAEDRDFPVLPASIRTFVPNADGGKTAVYAPVYGFEIARNAEIRAHNFRKSEKVFSVRLKSLSSVPETDFCPTIFDEFGRFPTPDEVRATVLADSEILDADKETKIRKRINGYKFEKARMESLARAVAPLKLRDLMTQGQGILVGVALKTDVRKNGSEINKVVKFFPATAISEGTGLEGTETVDDEAF